MACGGCGQGCAASTIIQTVNVSRAAARTVSAIGAVYDSVHSVGRVDSTGAGGIGDGPRVKMNEQPGVPVRRSTRSATAIPGEQRRRCWARGGCIVDLA